MPKQQRLVLGPSVTPDRLAPARAIARDAHQRVQRQCARCGRYRWTRRRWASTEDVGQLVEWGESRIACSDKCHAEYHGMTLAEMRTKELSLLYAGVTPPSKPRE